MTNLEKMNELVGATANKEQIKHWAYDNRVTVSVLHFESEFKTMENSVNSFLDSDSFSENEFKNWDEFLESEYVS